MLVPAHTMTLSARCQRVKRSHGFEPTATRSSKCSRKHCNSPYRNRRRRQQGQRHMRLARPWKRFVHDASPNAFLRFKCRDRAIAHSYPRLSRRHHSGLVAREVPPGFVQRLQMCTRIHTATLNNNSGTKDVLETYSR